MNRFTVKMLIICGLLSGLAFAQGSESDEPSSQPTPRTSNLTVTRTVSGSISSINSTANQLVVKDSAGKLHTLRLSEETKYQVGTKTLAARDLHEGERVKVTYRADDSTATEVRLAAGKARKS